MDAKSIGEHLLVVSGPSGVGKTTLVQGLLKRHPALRLSVSYTTRAPRGSEREGADYHFVDRATFEGMVEARELAEWAEVHGNLYGTSKAVIAEAVKAGADLIFDIDYQGTEQLQAIYPTAWSVLLSPPSITVLDARLRGRGTDTEAVVQRRMSKARFELSKVESFDFVVMNQELAQSHAAMDAIYAAMRMRRRRIVRSHAGLFRVT